MQLKIIEHSWYYQNPIDFEHKQLILFAYLKNVDDSFYNRIFSPWLLHTEKILDDMRVSLDYIQSFRKQSTKKSLFISMEGLSWMDNKPNEKDIEIIEEILKFSIPLLEKRVDIGREFLSKYPKKFI